MFRELLSVGAVFFLLCASAGLGILIRPRLPAHHRERETVQAMQVTIGLLATFAALVLGLLTASVKQGYDTAAHDRQKYALMLSQLDQCLRDYGPETETARSKIHSYTAAVIASTWPSEPPPAGVAYPDTSGMPRVGAAPVLSRLIDQVGMELAGIATPDEAHRRLLALCLGAYQDVSSTRLRVIEDARSWALDPFYQVLVFWLMIIFVCFGLAAPNHSLSMVTIVLCALSLSTVIFVILDLSQPYGGVFSIPSTSMREALNAMLAVR